MIWGLVGLGWVGMLYVYVHACTYTYSHTHKTPTQKTYGYMDIWIYIHTHTRTHTSPPPKKNNKTGPRPGPAQAQRVDKAPVAGRGLRGVPPRGGRGVDAPGGHFRIGRFVVLYVVVYIYVCVCVFLSASPSIDQSCIVTSVHIPNPCNSRDAAQHGGVPLLPLHRAGPGHFGGYVYVCACVMYVLFGVWIVI